MIVGISGQLVEKTALSLIVNVQGLHYEVMVPPAILQRVDEHIDAHGHIRLMTFHYMQLTPSQAVPVLIGFLNEVERDFFQQFITVSGIGPRAAVKALIKPISDIAAAIDQGDVNFLKTLPGIGLQKAKEVVAKLQGKVGKYALMRDKVAVSVEPSLPAPDWQEEALTVLLQLQYKKHEALEMIQKAVKLSHDIHSVEDLLNEIYKQRAHR